MAQKYGCPTALLGHGFGPAKGRDLLRLAGPAIRRADLITIRERRTSLPFLRSMGVSDSKIEVTGDDAIELAYSTYPETIGECIGINLRRANYSGVGDREIAAVRDCLRRIRSAHNAPFLPIPIAYHQEDDADSDFNAIRELLNGFDIGICDSADAINVTNIIRRIGKCRLVITGSYHAAVLALSQGISAIGLAGSQYYVDKFEGLADMFGAGCAVIDLNHDELLQELSCSFERLWENAHACRPTLILAAQQQIEMGHKAYRRLHDVCEILTVPAMLDVVFADDSPDLKLKCSGCGGSVESGEECSGLLIDSALVP